MKELLKLKKSLFILGMSTCLVGCENSFANENRKMKQLEFNYETHKEQQEGISDTHCIVNIDNKKIIFRNCEDYLLVCEKGYKGSFVTLCIYDSFECNQLIDCIEASNYIVYDGDNKSMLEFEEELIEEGAKIYKLSK